MKKAILPILVITMLMVIMGPNLVMALDTTGGIPTNDSTTGAGGNPPVTMPGASSLNIWDILKKALNWFFNIVIIVGALYIVYAGWLYITAGGDDEKAKKGLSGLVQALIGIGIALLAKGLIFVVSQGLTGTGINLW